MNEIQIFNYISGQANKKETQAVRSWAATSYERQKELSRIKNLWILTSLNNEISPQMKEDEIRKIRKKIAVLKRKQYFNDFRFRKIHYAATVIILVGLSIGFGYFISKGLFASDEKFTEIIVPKGERSKFVLPDGSKVQLNSSSKLKFNSFNTKERKVILEGEAYFDVIHDSSRPFIVEASGLLIEDLGTSFNISNYPDDQSVVTYLHSGEIRVDLDKKEVFLKPSEVFSYNKENKGYSVSVVNDLRIIDWTKNILTIKGETLEQLAKKLERRFDIQITFRDEDLKERTYSGSIKDEDLDTVLEAIKYTSTFNYERKGQNVILYSEK